MQNLKSNHEQKIEEMKNNREKDKYAHEKEMKNIESSKKELMEQNKNEHEEKIKAQDMSMMKK